MSNVIFLKNNDNKLVPLTETLYEAEDDLQVLIENNHALLAGDQITPEEPRKWILISREYGVPNQENGGAFWYLDHLFLDQDAIPTLVEVKRSTDTRIRREVIGQMLDYAANGTKYWKSDEIQKLYGGNLAADLEISEERANDYWNLVDSNLKLGKIRLIFAADKIPESLQRVIEFMNNQMQDTEVLGLEIKQFTSTDGKQLFAPKLIGRTLQAVEIKQKSNSHRWDRDSFLEDVKMSNGEELALLAERILNDFHEALGCRIWYGKGAKHASIVIVCDGNKGKNGVKCQMFSFYAWTNSSYCELYFKFWKSPYDTDESKLKLKRKFEDILGITIDDKKIHGRQTFDARLLLDENKYRLFFNQIKKIADDFRSQQCME